MIKLGVCLAAMAIIGCLSSERMVVLQADDVPARHDETWHVLSEPDADDEDQPQ
jgi:hypothetical protein